MTKREASALIGYLLTGGERGRGRPDRTGGPLRRIDGEGRKVNAANVGACVAQAMAAAPR